MLSWMWSLWVMAALTAGSSPPSFSEHIQVEKAGHVTITCRTDFKGNITWKKDNELQEGHEGPKMELHDFQDWSAGNYSCWGAGDLLDKARVLLEDTPDSTTPELKCWAENYNCTFQCVWPDPHYNAVRLRNERDNGTWVYSSPEGVFTVPHLTDAHSEETTPFKVTLQAIHMDGDKMLQINKTFYLRDIIQPPPPQIEVCKEGNVLEVDIKPADSWVTPSSYYPLEYQIEYHKKNDGKVVRQLCCKEEGQDCWTTVKCQVHVRVARFRVRSRDPLVKSDWGQWTEWTNVGKRTNKEKKGEKRVKSNEEKTKKKGKGKKKRQGKGKEKGKKSRHTCNPPFL